MKLTLIPLAALCLLFSACSNVWIAPPYTDSEKIIGLKSSMSIDDVTSQLGIPPFDVYHLQEDGSTVLVYNYRLKNRRMSYGSDVQLHDEESQTAGKLWYSKKSFLVYVLFQDGKMKSLVTDAGRDDSEALLITNNSIELLSKDELDLYELAKMRFFLESSTGNVKHNAPNALIPINKKLRKKKK